MPGCARWESGAVARISFRPVSHLRELPYSISDETWCASPVRAYGPAEQHRASPIFPEDGTATISVFSFMDGVFLERLTGLFAYGISGKSRSFYVFRRESLAGKL